MVEEISGATARKNSHPQAPVPASTAQSITIASGGIRTDRDAAHFLSALIGDVMTGAVPVRPAQTSVNAMGKLLKVVEMRHKYGNPEDQNRTLNLLTPDQENDIELKRLAEVRSQAEDAYQRHCARMNLKNTQAQGVAVPLDCDRKT